MKKIIYSMLIAASLLTSCSSSDDDKKVSTGDFSKNPVSGVVYSKKFTLGGGIASPLKSNGEDTFYIFLSGAAIDCDSDSDESSLWLIVPATVGSHDSFSGAQVVFQDTASDDYEGATAKIEILSITSTTVKGRIISEGFRESENSVNGTFTAQLCTE